MKNVRAAFDASIRESLTASNGIEIRPLHSVSEMEAAALEAVLENDRRKPCDEMVEAGRTHNPPLFSVRPKDEDDGLGM